MMQEWFKKAKLGVFLHWGLYAVEGIIESWGIANGDISYNDYMKQLEGFTASKYDPQKWAKLFKQAGANYAVLTTKHHDGVALFDTKYSDLNVVKKTPAGRDLIGPYCDALREEGLKVGLYFTNTDWSDIDNLSIILDKTPEEIQEIRKVATNIRSMWVNVLNRENSKSEVTLIPEKVEAWERFMKLYRGQLEEILTSYGIIDLVWFDVMLERKGYSWGCEITKKLIDSINPNTVINSRLEGFGDYETPEVYIPLVPLEGPWELCTTFNESWGYRPEDTKYKTVRQIVRMFCECISKGGNMLISAGPTPEGEIPPECEKLMIELGEWTHKYAEAIYPTTKGLDPAYFQGGTTLTEDNKTLYLFVYDNPTDNILVNGIRSKIKKITSLTSGNELTHCITGGADWLNMPGCIWITVNQEDIDKVCSVIKVEFEDELDLVSIKHVANSVGGM